MKSIKSRTQKNYSLCLSIVPYLSYLTKTTFLFHTTHMVTFLALSHPVLYILTSFWGICSPNAGWNMPFQLIFNPRELSVDRKDLNWASTLMKLTREYPVLDPLAVLHLDQQRCILQPIKLGWPTHCLPAFLHTYEFGC